MTESPRFRLPALSILIGLSGWAALFFSSHSKLISTAAAAMGGVLWTAFVGLTSKIWARVEKTIVELISDALDIYIRDFASRYRKRYLEHLQHRHRTFDVKGLSTQGIYALEIEQVYVELTVDPTAPGKASANPIAKLEAGRHDIWTFLASPQMKRQDFAILGAPGSGKTTLLKHITLGLAANGGKFRGLKRLPVLLFIRDHAPAIAADPQKTIADIAEEVAVKMGIPAPKGWFGRGLARGRCLVMLDGLDEVADAAVRKAVAEWVDSQLQAFGKNRFLVTSRPFGYKSNPLSRVSVLEVRPFSSEQSERFIKNWYRANEVMSAQKDDEGVRIAAREGAADLLRRIRATPSLAELSVNPLLLTMIANVHRYRSSLPGRRVELYAEICEVFLGKRQQARGMELDLTPAQKRRVLQPLAFHMMCAEKREIPLAEAVQTISGPLALVNDKVAPEDFLRSVENSSGLLLERENGVYSFAHLTFQEYLAASHIVEEKQEAELAKRVAVPWWHETIRLYVALADATCIVEACISDAGDASGVVKLTLAVECLEEALQIRPDLRSKVESLVIAGLEDPSPERARLAAETKLALRLRRLARIDDDHYIDNDLISCAEYQLFIDAHRAVGNYQQPDHWSGTHFPGGSARQPVLGVRPSDAVEFCRWLSECEGSEWSYQIPDRGVGGQLPTNSGYWVGANGEAELCGGASTEITLEMLKARLSKDSNLVVHPRTRDVSSDLNRAFAAAVARTRAGNRDRDLAQARIRARTSDLAFALDFARNFTFDRDLDFGFIGARVRDHLLARNFTFDRDLDFDLAGARARAVARNLSLALDRARALARAVCRLVLLFGIMWGEQYEMARELWYAQLLRRWRRTLDNSLHIDNLLHVYVSLVILEERIKAIFLLLRASGS
jgi:NACHT domain/Sulfatase-modifying factor enzyme 1